MKTNKDIQQFFENNKPHFTDSNEFVAKVNGRISQYDQYEVLLAQLKASQKHNKKITIAFLGLSVLYLALFVLLIAQSSLEAKIMELFSDIPIIMNSHNLYIFLLSAITAGLFFASSLIYIRNRD